MSVQNERFINKKIDGKTFVSITINSLMVNLSKEQFTRKGCNAFPMHETSSDNCLQPIRNELRRLQRVKNP